MNTPVLFYMLLTDFLNATTFCIVYVTVMPEKIIFHVQYYSSNLQDIHVKFKYNIVKFKYNIS